MLKFNIVVDQCAVNTSYMLLLKKLRSRILQFLTMGYANPSSYASIRYNYVILA